MYLVKWFYNLSTELKSKEIILCLTLGSRGTVNGQAFEKQFKSF